MQPINSSSGVNYSPRNRGDSSSRKAATPRVIFIQPPLNLDIPGHSPCRANNKNKAQITPNSSRDETSNFLTPAVISLSPRSPKNLNSKPPSPSELPQPLAIKQQSFFMRAKALFSYNILSTLAAAASAGVVIVSSTLLAGLYTFPFFGQVALIVTIAITGTILISRFCKWIYDKLVSTNSNLVKETDSHSLKEITPQLLEETDPDLTGQTHSDSQELTPSDSIHQTHSNSTEPTNPILLEQIPALTESLKTYGFNKPDHKIPFSDAVRDNYLLFNHDGTEAKEHRGLKQDLVHKISRRLNHKNSKANAIVEAVYDHKNSNNNKLDEEDVRRIVIEKIKLQEKDLESGTMMGNIIEIICSWQANSLRYTCQELANSTDPDPNLNKTCLEHFKLQMKLFYERLNLAQNKETYILNDEGKLNPIVGRAIIKWKENNPK